jgi:GntR family transcriptional regulator
LFLILEVNSEQPIYLQIRDQIIAGIADGHFQPGTSLPSIRQLAADFGINLHTVNKAYDLLEREGFIQLRRKTGAVIQITPTLSDTWKERQRTLLAEAYAKNVSPEEILEHCQQILAEFTSQRMQYNHPQDWSN